MASKAQIQLREKLKKLKQEQLKHKEDLNAVIREVGDGFEPGNMIKSSITSIISDKRFRRDIFETITPIITSFVSSAIIRKSRSSKVRILAAASELGINGLSTTYGRHIKAYSKAFFDMAKETISKKK